MAQDTIRCPKCGEVIPLSQAIYREIEEDLRGTYQKKADETVNQEIKKLQARESVLQKEYEAKAGELTARLRREALEKNQAEIRDLKTQLDEKGEKLRKAEQQELELLKAKRELEEKTRTAEIELERRLAKERQQIIDKISIEAQESHRLKDAEKEKQLAEMRSQIEELKRKAEQGSQKTQGEVLELELEEALRREFPFDSIEPVASGAKGGDIIQIVKTQSGRECGKILWETKRTKNWSEQWIQKLKGDLRDVKADIAVLVSEALPEGFRQFREINGVWVTDIP
ncbi:MAG: DUF2130 domain-containing protein, partial [Candidatus Omnitrophota bacterium]